MCEETYSGCPNCAAPSDDVRWEARAMTNVSCYLDMDGDVDWSSVEYGDTDMDEITQSDGSLWCGNCGHSDFSELESGLIPEDCECDECDTERGLDSREPDEVVILCRNDTYLPSGDRDYWPEPIQLLYSRRSARHVCLTIEAARDAADWLRDEQHESVEFIFDPSDELLRLALHYEPMEVSA